MSSPYSKWLRLSKDGQSSTRVNSLVGPRYCHVTNSLIPARTAILNVNHGDGVMHTKHFAREPSLAVIAGIMSSRLYGVIGKIGDRNLLAETRLEIETHMPNLGYGNVKLHKHAFSIGDSSLVSDKPEKCSICQNVISVRDAFSTVQGTSGFACMCCTLYVWYSALVDTENTWSDSWLRSMRQDFDALRR